MRHLQEHSGFATTNLRVSIFYGRDDQIRLDSLNSNCIGIDISYDIPVSRAIMQGRSKTREHPGGSLIGQSLHPDERPKQGLTSSKFACRICDQIKSRSQFPQFRAITGQLPINDMVHSRR